MLNPIWRRCLRQLLPPFTSRQTPRRARSGQPIRCRVRLEELEPRLAPASFAVNAQLQVSRLDNLGDTPCGAHAVVFFESAVANYQVLREGLDAETDAVVLDTTGDGLKEMAAFLAGRHDLTAIGVVTHGAPGRVALGRATLNVESLGGYMRELAVVGSALGRGGELDLWSCDIAAGHGGETLVRDLAVATRAGVAAAGHTIGSPALGGNWQLDVRAAGARGEVPFSAVSLGAFRELLDTWMPAASMATGRNHGTATLLNNGKVLVTGGDFSTASVPSPLSSAEIYDPVSNTWSSAGSMATARFWHAATLLRNGKVLVTGGVANGGPTLILPSSAELYDPASNTWSAAGSMPQGASLPTATLLQSGNVLVVGYYGVSLYDPTSNTWSVASSMATVRSGQTATMLANGKVLVAGGDASGSAELYDPVSNTWSSAGSMATARSGQTATLLGNGQVLVTGGADTNSYLSSAELYDPASNSWSTAASMGTARGQATLLSNGEVLLTGGMNYSATSFAALSSAELYDPVSNTWSAAASMATARWNHKATLLSNGEVLVTGGLTGNNNNYHILSSAELYDPAGIGPSLSKSTISVAPATISSGGRATVTLTARDDSGKPLTSGGLPFTFGSTGGGLFASGSFSNLTDNHNGTYTAIFTGNTGFGTATFTITATLNGQPITSPLPTITVSLAVPATQLAISNFSATSVSAGSAVAFTVSAEDSTGAPVPTYTGTVQLTSSDGHALLSGNGLPASYTFIPSDNGIHTFTVMFQTAGTQTITATDEADKSLTATTSPITVTAGPFSKFVVSVPDGNVLTAGAPFLFTARAADQFGNPVTSYSGPTTITAAASPPDPQANLPIPGTLNNNGFSFFLGNLNTAGSYTITVTAGSVVGASDSLTVTPSAANYFKLSAPAEATTGSPVNVTVTAFDHFGNMATGYTGTVKLTSSDPAAGLASKYTFTSGPGMDNGVHVFSATLGTGGSQTITATDAASTNPTVTGISNAITTRGLAVVGTPTVTATGFSLTFSKPFVPGALALYGGPGTLPDVTLVGKTSGPISGTLLVDPANTSVTFKATNSSLAAFYGAPVLPDDTYTLRLVSGTGSHGFHDPLGAGLDGANDGGHADYTTSFTVANAGKMILSIPDFARGPGGAATIKVPNDSAHGIPITLTNAAGVKDVSFTLSYNPALLTVAGASTADASGAGSAFTLLGAPTILDATHATASVSFHNDAPQTGTVVLGDIVASVPNSAASSYKAKELLSLSAITVNGAAFTGVSANGVHVNAYLGDVTGNGTIDGLDLATAAAVAQGTATGFAAFGLLDPAIIGDPASDLSVDAGDISTLAAFSARVPTPAIPAIPAGLPITPVGADPTLSLGAVGRIENPSYVNVPVQLDNPHPEGSTGMTEAALALTYDPTMLSVSAADVTLGTIPSLGTGWHLTAVVDLEKGQIGIILYSTTPIEDSQGGSLVNIVFHTLGEPSGVSRRSAAPLSERPLVQLVDRVIIGGEEFITQVDDAQGQLTLSPGRDRLAVNTSVELQRASPRVSPRHPPRP